LAVVAGMKKPNDQDEPTKVKCFLEKETLRLIAHYWLVSGTDSYMI